MTTTGDPPRFEVDSRIRRTTTYGEEIVGWIGSLPNRRGNPTAALLDRDTSIHFVPMIDGYPVYLDTLKRMKEAGVTTILIREIDTDDVYEYSFLSIAFGQEYQERDGEPARVASRFYDCRIHRTHGPQLVLPQEHTEAVRFQTAAALTSWRRHGN